ncbi:MAG: leucine-rich repeat domain-containing protein [Prevotellaceae bacterium]|jgi:hypothetical protein|nr:leucine-rich repeat domain-containing protein [Prevotellaceae bacterium]
MVQTKTKLSCKRLIALLAFAMSAFATPAMAQTYNTGDIAVINNIISNNGLYVDLCTDPSGATVPQSWNSKVIWTSDPSDKRITDLDLDLMFLSGTLDVSALTALEKLSVYCNSPNYNLTGLNLSGCSALRELDCGNNFLSSLDLSACTSLVKLNCFANQLTALDVSPCSSSLKWLNCGNNYSLAVLDVSACTALEYLSCHNCPVGALNVSACSNLEYLYCQDIGLSSLDVSGLSNLKELHCDSNSQMTALNISGCSALEVLECYYNNLATLDISDCRGTLEYLDCSDNKLTTLDVANCSSLQTLYCHNNKLTELDLTGLPIGDFYGFGQNSDLTMTWNAGTSRYESVVLNSPSNLYNGINVDGGKLTVPDASLTATTFTVETGIQGFTLSGGITLRIPGTYNLGDIAVINDIISNNGLAWTTCTDLTGATVPDNWGWGNTEWTTDLTDKRIKRLNVSWRNLTGTLDVSGLAALTYLECIDNQLNGLNVSGCSALEELYCSYNQLTGTLDLSTCTALMQLQCNENRQMTALNVAGLSNLRMIICYDTQVTALDVSGCNALEELYCSWNQLAGTLDVSGLSNLLRLECNNNQLDGLNASNCTALLYLDCNANQLATLDVSGSTALEELHCSYNQLTTLDVSGLNNLQRLECHSNQLNGLNVSIALKSLNCSYNQLTTLDVSTCSVLEELYCHDNQLTTLDVSSLSYLYVLNCTNNQIATLNVAGCSALKYIECYFNKLTTLNVAGFGSLTNLNCSYNELTTLTVSGSALNELYCGSNKLTELDLSGLSLSGFDGSYQTKELTMNWNPANSQYEGSIQLNNPSNLMAGLTAAGGQLTTVDPSINLTDFIVETGNQGLELSGEITLSYPGLYNTGDIAVINNIISNNGLNWTPCIDQTGTTIPADWTGITWSSLPTDKRIKELNMVNKYFTGALDVAGLTDLEKLNINCNNNGYNYYMTGLDVSGCSALKYLSCNYNYLPALDVTNCSALTQLDCSRNNLTTLDLSNCAVLEQLNCSYNNLPTLDLSPFSASLTRLECSNSYSLTALDVTSCAALTYLDCHSSQQLVSLDVLSCSNLEQLYCQEIGMSSLNVSNLTKLEVFHCDNNYNLTTVDISGCTALKDITCYFSKLSALDLSDCRNTLEELEASYAQLSALDVSNCSNLRMLSIRGNKLTKLDLTGLTLSQYYLDYQDAELEMSWNPTNSRYESTVALNNPSNLSNGIIADGGKLTTTNASITSTSFAVETGLQNIKLTGDIKLRIPNLYYLGDIAVINELINSNGLNWTLCDDLTGATVPSDWTGITWNSNPIGKRIEGLNIANMNLSGTLDVSGLADLKSLDCSDNNFSGTLNASGLSNLEELYCDNNPILTGLNIAGCTALKYLKCNHNKLVSLDISACKTVLELLHCGYNKLRTLDVTGCTALQSLTCEHNYLTELNLTNLTVSTFDGVDQETEFMMNWNLGTSRYESVALNSPSGLSSGITADGSGKLTALNTSVLSTTFIAETGLSGKTLSGTIDLTYFAAVSSIAGIPATSDINTDIDLSLATVTPSVATNQSIVWSIYDAGTTGASIASNTLRATSAGNLILRASIANGMGIGSDYTQDFNITIASAVTNTGGSATVNYTGTAIDLSLISGLFSLDVNAGIPTYSIETAGSPTGAGTIASDDKSLTVTSCGTFTIGLVTAANGNYAAGAKVTATLTVNKGTMTFPAHNDLTATYNSSLQLIDLSLDADYEWDAPYTSLNAGDNQPFAATYTEPSGNYNPASGSVKVSVAKTTISINALIYGWTYGDAANTPSVSMNPEGNAVTYWYATAKNGTYGTTQPTAAGAYWLYADMASSSNYAACLSDTIQFTIAPREATVVWTNSAFTYNGSSQVPTASAAGTQADGNVSLNISGAQTNAGIGYKAYATSADANYTLINDTVYFDIAKAGGAATSAPSLSSKTHDSITVNTIPDAANGQTIEYAIAETDNATPTTGWQSSTIFDNLAAAHTYYIYARTAENSNYLAGTAQVSAAITTDDGITGVSVLPNAVSVQKGTTQAFTADVQGGVGVPTTVTWSITTSVSVGTSIDGNGLLTVANDEPASALTVRAVSTFDASRYAEATVSLYAETTIDNGSIVTTPPGGDPIDNGDGTTTLPDGGTITPPNSNVEVEVPPGTVIDDQGNINIPPVDGNGNGDGGRAVYPDTGVEIDLPPGTIIDEDGNITFPDNGGGTATYPDTGTIIDLPPGTIIDGNGNITFPDDGSGNGGGTATYPDDGTIIDLPPGTKIEIDDDGKITITPGDGGAKVTDPNDGSIVDVPGDGSQIIIDPAHPEDGVLIVLVPKPAHLAYPNPMSAIYSGAAQAVAVNPASGVNGMGAIAVYYNGLATAPTDAGLYAITVDIAASKYFKAATGLSLGDYAIDKASVAVVWTNTTLPYSGSAQRPTAEANGVLGEAIALTVSGEQSEIGTGYTATADLAAPSTNYVLTNLSVSFEIVANPNYEYAVNFDVQGGSAVASQAVKYGHKATLPAAPTRDNRLFDGWFKTSACNAGEEWDFDADLITSDTIIYAGWSHELSHEAELVTLSVNGVYIHSTLVGNSLTYTADCGEDVVNLEITASDSARIFINGEESEANSAVQLSGETSQILIAVHSESGTTIREYNLTVHAALSGERLYFQRWDDVLAINHNPANNGGRIVTGVRWYKGDEMLGTDRYIMLAGQTSAYRAEVEIDGVWRKLCAYVGTRAIGVAAYPNPVSRGESLTLQVPEAFVNGTLSIYTIAGVLVKTGIALPSSLSSHSLADLAEGIYLFRITSTNGQSETVKIIVN